MVRSPLKSPGGRARQRHRLRRLQLAAAVAEEGLERLAAALEHEGVGDPVLVEVGDEERARIAAQRGRAGDEAARAVAEEHVEGARLAGGGGLAGDQEIDRAVEVEIGGLDRHGNPVQAEGGGAGELAAAVAEGEDEGVAAGLERDRGEVDGAAAVEVGDHPVLGGPRQGVGRGLAPAEPGPRVGADHRRQRLLEGRSDRWDTCGRGGEEREEGGGAEVSGEHRVPNVRGRAALTLPWRRDGPRGHDPRRGRGRAPSSAATL